MNASIGQFTKGHNSRTTKVTPPKFELELDLVVITIVYYFITLGSGKLKGEWVNYKLAIFLFIKGHNLIIVKVMPHKFKLELFGGNKLYV